jgi:uncharacterized protein YbjT (DUF2867 family)
MKILVMGATGYIGGRLVPLLLEQGHEVRCLSRRPEKLRGVWWAGDCEIVQGDALDPESLTPAMSNKSRRSTPRQTLVDTPEGPQLKPIV